MPALGESNVAASYRARLAHRVEKRDLGRVGDDDLLRLRGALLEDPKVEVRHTEIHGAATGRPAKDDLAKRNLRRSWACDPRVRCS